MTTDNERFAEPLDSLDFQMITSFNLNYIDNFRQYFFIGVMPKCCTAFSENKDFNEAREVH